MLKKSILLTTSVALALSVAAPAAAQDDDEIIVTATKRATTLQATPVAVTVTSADTIEKSKILDIKDLQSVVPSLRVTQLQTSADTNFIIRGFGNGANNAGIEPSVGVFVDGVYRSRSAAALGDLPKLQRVEVLKGPQSTLFGKNASAGVISVVTAKPTYAPQGYVEAGLGNYNQRIVKGYMAGGLTENFAVSLGAGLHKRDGYYEANDPTLTDTNDRDRFNIRGQALYEPTDNISFRVIADYSSIREVCCGVTNVQNQGASAAVAALGGQFAPDTDVFSYVNYENRDSFNTVDDKGVSFHADIDFDFATLTSITAYRQNDSTYDQAADFNSLRLLDGVRRDQDIATFTQEVRLTSTGDGPVDWMVGGFLFEEDITAVTGLTYGDQLQPYINVLLQGAGAPAGLMGTLEGLYGFGPNTFLGGGGRTDETFTQSNTAYSLFGTVDYNVSDKLTLTGGLNYTRDKKNLTGDTVNGDVWSNIDLNNQLTLLGAPLPTVFFGQFFQQATGLAPTPGNIAAVEMGAPGTSAAIQASVAGLIAGLQGTQFQPQFLGFPNSVENGQSDDDKVTYIARLAYEVNDSINVYGSYGTGFKSTSWNLSRDSRPFASDAAALTGANLTQNNQNYGSRFANPEEATVIEFGLKTKFDNGSLNVAIFDQTIKGFQSNVFQGTGFVLANAGEQSTKGIEVEGTYRLGDLTLSAAGTFLDPVYDDYQGAPGPNNTVVDLSGEQPAGIPEVSLSLGALYNHDFGNDMNGFIRADYQYESDVRIVDTIPTVTTSAGQTYDLNRKVSVFNASAGLDFGNGVSASVWGRNIFGNEYLLSAFPGVAQAGVINSYANEPATYGATLRYDFD